MPSSWRWIVPLATAGLIWVLPHGHFDTRSWSLLCLFAAAICALITRPVAAGALMIGTIAMGALLRLFSIQDGLSGYANVTVWLILAAFLFARGLVVTRLGERIAYGIVKRVGGSPLGLGYSIVLADLVMAPMTASNTARAGGILFPITLNVARVFDSEPGPTASRIGSFLLLTLYHGDLVVSAMFLTACAPNPLVADIVRQGSAVRLTWTLWAVAASVPGIVALIAIPYLVYRLSPPERTDTAAARTLAAERLAAMGPLSGRERGMLIVFSVVLALWIAGDWLAISPTTAAMLGVAMLLLVGVLEWRDIIEEKSAWDVFVWFGGLMMLAGQLEKAGFPKAFAQGLATAVHGWPWWWALVVMLIVYLYAHYAFASLVAHVTAMFPAFFATAMALGAPPLVAAVAFGVLSNVNAAMTHYGTGPAPIVFGAGYVSQPAWWRIGFIVSLAHLAIWLPIGFLWWKVLGLW
ncbi:MAG TPA: DASS family sodium-coupled anion symporter [Vicinamibacterales bacterium]|jgi:DASS family divalent anion:Na+ symporter